MLFSTIRRVVLVAATASLALFGGAHATDIDTDALEFDATAIIAQHNLDYWKQALAPVEALLGDAYKKFSEAVVEAIDAGELTLEEYYEKRDECLNAVEKHVAGFKNIVKNLLSEAEVDATKFFENAHDATWEVISYGVNVVNEELNNDAITKSFEKLEKYVNDNIEKASTKDLQKRIDAFFKEADAEVEGFRESVVEATKSLLDYVENGDEGSESGEGAEEEGDENAEESEEEGEEEEA